MSSPITFYKILGLAGGGVFMLLIIGTLLALQYPLTYRAVFYDMVNVANPPFPTHYQNANENIKPPPVGCASDAQCNEGFSCWYEIPAGPSAGIRGSKEYPGACWDNDILSQIY